MANVITIGEAYDPFFYANEALIQLNKQLGWAFWVHRGFDRTPTEKGSRIKIRRPGKFTAQSMPIALASATDITPEYMDLNVDQWEGDMFALTDKELTLSRDEIVSEHVGPLAIAVADKIDQTVAELQNDVPYFLVGSTSAPVEDFAEVRKIMADNNVPGSRRRYVVGSNLQLAYEKESVFYQANTGVDAALLQREGFLGRKFGFDISFNSNTQAHTAGTLSDTTPLVNGVFAKGLSAVNLDDTSLTGATAIGDSFKLDSDSFQRYAVTNIVTASGNALAAVGIEPQLQRATVDDEAVTYRQVTASERGCAFHANAFALGMAPLSSLGDGAGARIATVTDPLTGITLRTTIFYDPGTAKNYVRIDALWGVKTLDPNLAVNVEVA